MVFQVYKRYQGQQRRIERKIILSSEGKCSEPHYLDGIRRSLRLKKEQLVYATKGVMPLTAVERAIQKRDELIRERAYSEADGDTTWAAFDGEEHRNGSTNNENWKKAISLATSNSVKLANSEPCIELWFLLHLGDQTGHIDRVEARRKLKSIFGEYEKGDEAFFDSLQAKGNERAASERATKLRSMHSRNCNDPHFTNPCTRMDDLVKAIRELGKNENA